MGYSSEVALVLNKESNEKLQKTLKGKSADEKALFNEWKDRHEVDSKTGAALYYWSGIKWYGDECDCVNDFLSGLEAKDYHFMRLGESYGDIDEHGEFYDCAFNFIATSVIEI